VLLVGLHSAQLRLDEADCFAAAHLKRTVYVLMSSRKRIPQPVQKKSLCPDPPKSHMYGKNAMFSVNPSPSS